MENNLIFTVSDKGVAKIILNRPDFHNAFDDSLIKNMLTILQLVNNDSNIKILLISAEGKSFSAGADLNWMRRIGSYSFEENVNDAGLLSDLMKTLKFLNKPTVARVQGSAFGGGVGLLACCDIVIASTTANFCLSEVKIGLLPAVISPYIIAAIGERAARRYILTAEMMSASKALHLGLIHEAVVPEKLDFVIQEIIGKLLLNSPQAINAAKKLINRVSENPYCNDHAHKNIDAIATIRVSKEGQEGLAAFLEKRKPAWVE